jgi:Amt family ammonium transporter
LYVGARKVKANAYSNMTLVMIGSLIVWFAFYGFSCGSTFGLSGVGETALAHHAAKIAFTITLGAAAGAITSLALSRLLALKDKFNTYDMYNGAIAGLVATASGAGMMEEYAGACFGIVAGILYVVFARILERAGLDDGLRTVTVHLISGFWGMIATGLWARESDIVRAYPFLIPRRGLIRYGIFYGGGAQLFGLNILISVCIGVWSFVLTLITLWVIDRFGALRLTELEQEHGADGEVAITDEARKHVEGIDAPVQGSL